MKHVNLEKLQGDLQDAICLALSRGAPLPAIRERIDAAITFAEALIPEIEADTGHKVER